MALPALTIPEDPMRRFSALYTELLKERPWWQGRLAFRYAALALTTLPGDPTVLAARLGIVAEELRKATPWYERNAIGTLIAAMLLLYEDYVPEFLAEVERARPLFRERWRFGDRSQEMLAILVLRHDARDSHVSAAAVARLAAIYDELKLRHPWITNKSDWPACALLARSPKSPGEISDRLEAIGEALRGRGFRGGDPLQTATQILHFHEAAPATLGTRFAELYAAFKDAGLWMSATDYDEIAFLCFAPAPPASVLATVQTHREHILALPAKPDRQTSFTLACATALLELLRDAQRTAHITEAQTLVHIQAILAAQQQAAAAAAAAS